MNGHDQTVLAMGIGYALLGVVLLAILVFARFDWRLKAALIVVVSGFYADRFPRRPIAARMGLARGAAAKIQAARRAHRRAAFAGGRRGRDLSLG